MIPPNDEPSPCLIDAEQGTATLRLYPFHLKRLHGPWPSEVSPSEATPLGLHFPLLPNSSPVDVHLKGGQTPEEVGPSDLIEPNSELKDLSWWRWHGYARTPLGWVSFPTPFFRSGRLEQITLTLSTEESNPTGFDRAERILIEELGPPTESVSGKRFNLWPGRPAWGHHQRRWRFDWGTVSLYYEVRDWNLQIGVLWKS